MPPFPMANGPLFSVSASLAREIVTSEIPSRWLTSLAASEVVSFAKRRGAVPYALRRLGCWPGGDAVFGYWGGCCGPAPLAARSYHTHT